MSNIDWEEFKKGKIAVNCKTKADAYDFLMQCTINGFRILLELDKDLTISWGTYREKTCFYTFNGCFFYGHYEVESRLKNIVVYTPEQPSIHITTDGVTTIAIKKENGITINVTAKCSDDDIFDFMTGARIAFNRLNNEFPKACEFKPKQEFKPYLSFSGLNYGYIGEKTTQQAIFGKKLCVGDVVELYNTKNNCNCGEHVVCKATINKHTGADFIMGVAGRDFINGISEHWQIRKVKSFKSLVDGENIGETVAHLKESKGKER